MDKIGRRKLLELQEQIYTDSQTYSARLKSHLSEMYAVFDEEELKHKKLSENPQKGRIVFDSLMMKAMIGQTKQRLSVVLNEVDTLNLSELKELIGEPSKRPSRVKKPVVKTVIAPVTK